MYPSTNPSSERHMTRSSTIAIEKSGTSKNVYGSEKKPSSSPSFGDTFPSNGVSLKRKRECQSANSVSTKFQKHVQVPVKSAKPPIRAKPKPAKTNLEKDGTTNLSVEDASTLSREERKSSAVPVEVTKEEKRLRLFRKKAPLSYLEKLQRATTQRYPALTQWLHERRLTLRSRMFVLDRTRGGTDDVPEETIDMAGTTGNIYSITICQEPRCTCPDNQKGNQCKHIVYVRCSALKRRITV